jgi:hypothetical protein
LFEFGISVLSFEKYSYICTHNFAGMAKLVDVPDLGSGAARRVGSSPITRTFKNYKTLKDNALRVFCLFFCRDFAESSFIVNERYFFNK